MKRMYKHRLTCSRACKEFARRLTCSLVYYATKEEGLYLIPDEAKRTIDLFLAQGPHVHAMIQEFFNGKEACKSINPDDIRRRARVDKGYEYAGQIPS